MKYINSTLLVTVFCFSRVLFLPSLFSSFTHSSYINPSFFSLLLVFDFLLTFNFPLRSIFFIFSNTYYCYLCLGLFLSLNCLISPSFPIYLHFYLFLFIFYFLCVSVFVFFSNYYRIVCLSRSPSITQLVNISFFTLYLSLYLLLFLFFLVFLPLINRCFGALPRFCLLTSLTFRVLAEDVSGDSLCDGPHDVFTSLVIALFVFLLFSFILIF